MSPRGIDVSMPQNIGDDIDIARFTVEGGAIGGTQFMRRNLFEGSNDSGVLFDEIFHGPDDDPAILHGQEKRRGGFLRNAGILLFLLQIGDERVGDLVGKIEDRLISAFPRYDKRICGKIEALVVEPDELGDTDPRAEKEGEDRRIADLCPLMIAACMGRESRAELGTGLPPHASGYHERTKIRDTAILTLFLGTGIRISELVGLNNESLDFSTNSFVVTRKGGNQAILYFSDEVADALIAYLEQKKEDPRVPKESPSPLFLSMQYRRIIVRAVENLVKKYARIVTPLKKITPHKLRSTYGTALYRETGDIYIVADVLGHRDVNTTRRHYAAISEDNRRSVADAVKLHRPEDDDDE